MRGARDDDDDDVCDYVINVCARVERARVYTINCEARDSTRATRAYKVMVFRRVCIVKFF